MRRPYAVGAAVAWISGGLAYLMLEAVAAAAFRPHYSYVRNRISDLGATSPLAWLMNTAFCVQGTLFLVGAVLAVRAVDARKARLFLALAAANAVGNLLIAAFHSGPTGTAWVHASGAVLAIAGGNAAILAGWCVVSGPAWYRKVSIGLGGFGLVSFTMFAIESTTTAVHLLPPAVWERCSVYPIITWQMLTAAWLLLSRQPILSRAQARRA
ncbi:MAG: DUF998 domain-containing protein [Mycobacterium sp.]|uniref:DUF998 domain-containing protein n=1 Tax=Mycobacterium sp. TaxID=1785 RepID=UPI003BB4D9E7